MSASELRRVTSAGVIVYSEPGRTIEVVLDDPRHRLPLSDVQAQVLAEDLLPQAVAHARGLSGDDA